MLRSIDLPPVPVDMETRGQLVKLEEPVKVEAPVLKEEVMDELLQFIWERQLIDIFLEQDIAPSNSILLHGNPGFGKTLIAK